MKSDNSKQCGEGWEINEEENEPMTGSGKMKTVGTRREVWNETAKKTGGGLMKKDLFQDKNGRIRSKKASDSAKKKLQNNPKFKKYVEEAKKRKGKPFKLAQKK